MIFIVEKNVEVTVIVNVFNDEDNLEKCLYSLANQTIDKDKIEILIINDGSTDNSQIIINNYVNRYKNFRVITQSNKGIFLSRKIGIDNAKGEFIGWVDSDDFVEFDMFEQLYNCSKKYNSDLVYCNYHFYPHKVSTKNKWFKPFNGERNIDYVEQNLQLWNKLIKRSLLLNLEIDKLIPSCHEEAIIKCLLYAKKPYSLDKKLYYYHVGKDSISSSYKNIDYYKSFIKSSMNLKEAMKKLCSDSKYWNEYFNYRILYYILITMIVSANAGNKSEYLVMKKKFHSFNNKYFKHLMIKNYGLLKYIVMAKLLGQNYVVARLICKVALN